MESENPMMNKTALNKIMLEYHQSDIKLYYRAIIVKLPGGGINRHWHNGILDTDTDS